MNHLKAIVAPVPFGNFEIEGLMLPDGSFGIAVPQVAALFELNKATASREVKALLSKRLPLNKIASELNSKKVNYLTLKQFNLVITKLSFKGNQQAQNLALLLTELSLEQLWSDAFGIKFEKEERQKFLKQQMIHRKYYHDRFTPWTKLDLEAANITEKRLKGIEYGKRMNQLKLKLALPLEFIGTYTSDQLQVLNDGELVYSTLRSVGIDHQEALDKATEA